MRSKASDLARRTTYPPPPTRHRPALLLKNLRNTNVDHAEYTEGTLVQAGRDSLRDRSDDVALSRLKQGFDSPRERQ